MLTLLGVGFLLGMRHAFEADHAAAVASLALRTRSISQTLKQGLAWGMGHTLTLFVFGVVVLWVGSAVPPEYAEGLECLVGLMLVGLGLDVLRRLRAEHLHVHVHQHHDQPPHVHFHSHQESSHSGHDAHDHPHPPGFPYRALLVGTMHGMAGSAALILLALQQTISPGQAIGYILVFGAGSTIGMGLFSVVLAIPLWYSAQSFTRVQHGLQLCIGLVTTGLGLFVVYHNTGWWPG